MEPDEMDPYEDEGIEFEEPPEITELSGNEGEPDATTLAQIAWLLRRYTSHVFIARLRDLLAGLAGVYLQWTPGDDETSPETAAEWAQFLHDRIAALQQVLSLLERGQADKAYALLMDAIAGLEPKDARDELHFSLRGMTQVLGDEAQPWGERAGDMAQRIATTLAGQWCCETVLADRHSLRMRPRRIPEHLPPLLPAAANAPTVKTGKRISKTGLWLPTTIRNACPNFLVEGREAPELRRAGERLDYAATEAGGGEPAREAWSDYDYIDEPTVWKLVESDTRTRGAGVADDDSWLDADFAVPAGAARANG